MKNLKDYEKNLFTWCKSSIGNYKNTKKKNQMAYEDMVRTCPTMTSDRRNTKKKNRKAYEDMIKHNSKEENA